MAEYEFQIFCRGVDMSGDLFLDRLYEAGCDDALVSFKDGYVCLDFSRSSESAEEAVLSAIKDFEYSAVGGSIERVEPDDLASLSEIARRTGVTRASLQKYARGPSKVGEDFPQPAVNISGARRELYSAAEVINWMHAKERVVLPGYFMDLVNVIAKINQALFVVKARKDDEINRFVAQLDEYSSDSIKNHYGVGPGSTPTQLQSH
jgi:hypothetical protein